jgi:WD40 repeat protein
LIAAPEAAGSPLRFQAGGTLGEDAFYVERPADEELPAALRRGELCYVLSTRQIGKSSLRLRAMKRLRAEGVACVSIDLTSLGTDNTRIDDWYVGLTSEIALQLDLESPDAFWDQHRSLGPVHGWSRYLEDVVLVEVRSKIVIFIDEIDATLSLPFSRDDFFASVRALHNRRAERAANERLTFCLLGVAAPRDLIADPTRTPFNVGRAIRIEDFTRAEAEAFQPGLVGLAKDPGVLLDEVYGWTSGHPYMTQRVCDELTSASQGRSVEAVVRALFLERGRMEDPNLHYAERCFDDLRSLTRDAQAPRVLRLYRRVRMNEAIPADGSDPIQLALRLTGLAAERDRGEGRRLLCVRSQIFSEVFDLAWVSAREADRVIVEPLARWLDHGRKEGDLLRGAAFEAIAAWASGRDDLTPEETEFLQACHRAEDRRRARRRLIASLAVVLSIALGVISWVYRRAERAADDRNARRLARMADSEGSSGRAQRQMLLAAEAVMAGRRVGGPALRAAEQALGDAVRGVVRHSVLAGHGGRVNSATFSRDGERIVTASADGTARIWSTDGRAPPIILEGDTIALPGAWGTAAQPLRASTFTYAAFDHAGVRVAAIDGFVTWVWNATSPEKPLTLRGHESIVTSVEWSPDDARIVTGSYDKTARIWRADGQAAPVVLRGHEDWVTRAAFSPEGSLVATSSRDRTARIWRADGQGDPIVLRGHEDIVRSVAFSPDGSRVVTASDDKTARIWRADGKVAPVVLGGEVSSSWTQATFSSDGARVLVSSLKLTCAFRVDGQGKPICVMGDEGWSSLLGHGGWITSAEFSFDGARVVTTSYDHTARLWEADHPGRPIVLRGHEDKVNFAAWSPDGQRVVTASDDGTARIWQASGRSDPVVILGHIDAAFSPDGSLLASCNLDRTARISRADGGGELAVLRGHEDLARSISWSPDGAHVVTGSDDKTARVWRADGKGEPIVLRGHEGRIRGVSFSPDGTRIATCSSDDTVRLWNADGRGVPVVLRHEYMAAGVAFSGDGTRLATVSVDAARIWSADGRGEPIVLRHGGAIAGRAPPSNATAGRALPSIAFSPDGTRVAASAGDNTVLVWSADGRGEPVTLRGHSHSVTHVAFSPRGDLLVTSSEDSTALLWDLSRDDEPVALRHKQRVDSASFSPDGSRVLTISGWETRIWTVALDDLMRSACTYAGRNFTREEWSQFMLGASYRKTCPEWPEAPLPGK